ncbi:MAG TPA: aldehyde dehydrogenase family protein, partial [Verrucomicrobiae bacterium]|nr:aldehyde dehydrogenase family protein [Verrucomicrobiae bacterium]
MGSNGSQYVMTIDGKAVATAAGIDVRNPATGETFARAPAASAQDLENAVAAATRAFATWKNTPIGARKAAIIKAADIIDAHA